MTGPLMPGSILSMPAAAAERLIRLDSGDAALLYLYLLGHGNAAGLNWPRERLQGALDLLSAQGMAGAEAAPPAPGTPCSGGAAPRIHHPGRHCRPPGRRAPPSPPWRTRWSAAWASGCLPMT